MLVLMLIRELVLMMLVVMVMADTAGVGSDDDTCGDTDGDIDDGFDVFGAAKKHSRRRFTARLHNEGHARRAGRIAPCPASPRRHEGSRLS